MDRLKDIDILGKEFQMRINESFTYRTKLGGLFTILVCFIPIVSIYLFGRDIVEHKNPSFIFRKRNLQSFPYLTIDSRDYFFGLRVADDFGGWIDDKRFFEVLFNYQYYRYNETTGGLDAINSTIVPMDQCSTVHIDNLTLIKEDLATYYCANLDGLKFGGDWGQPEIGVITYIVKTCDKKTEETYGIKCFTPEERVELRGDTYFVETKYSNHVVDPFNFTNPLIKLIEYQVQLIDLNLYKRNYFSYSQASIATDVGVIQQEKILKTFSQVEKTQLDITGIKKDNKLFQFIVQLTNLQVEYERFYIKAQEIAATVGGFFSISYNIIKIIFYFYVDNHMQHFFYKKLLDLKIENEPSSNGETELGSSLRVIPFQSNNVNFLFDTESNSKMQSSNTEVQSLERRKTKSASVSSFHPSIPSTKIKKKEHENSANVNKEGKFQAIAENFLATKSNNFILSRDQETSGGQTASGARANISTQRLVSLLAYQKKERLTFQVSRNQLCKFKYCTCFNKKAENTDGNIVKTQLLIISDYSLNKQLDALQLLKVLDQFKIVKQIFLNENQCYMLENKGKKVICKSRVYNEEDFTKIIEEKKKLEEINLVKYIKDKKENKTINELDSFLFELMDEEIKNKVRKEVALEEN